MIIEQDVLLAPLTTFRIGGPTRFFVRVASADEMREAFAFARTKKIKTLVLGGGSNVLLRDEGFDGLVIKSEIAGIVRDESVLVAGAGERWDALVERAVGEHLWGMENLSGIPGTVGGAVAGSIGAYGQALSQTLLWAEVLDTGSGEIKKKNNEECRFGYRESVFSARGGSAFDGSPAIPAAPGEMNGSPTPSAAYFAPLIVLRAAFQLSELTKPALSYKDLAERFTGRTPSLGEIREAVLEIRRAKFPAPAEGGCAGSFFKNPVLSPAEAQILREKYPKMSLFALPETAGVKIPLAWLLDKALNLRGTRVGGARLYEKQPLVIVADANCAAADVRALAALVQKKVSEAVGIVPEPEVKIF